MPDGGHAEVGAEGRRGVGSVNVEMVDVMETLFGSLVQGEERETGLSKECGESGAHPRLGVRRCRFVRL
jgi:hypothetical protein